VVDRRVLKEIDRCHSLLDRFTRLSIRIIARTTSAASARGVPTRFRRPAVGRVPVANIDAPALSAAASSSGGAATCSPTDPAERSRCFTPVFAYAHAGRRPSR
jgi:hypothetical protein